MDFFFLTQEKGGKEISIGMEQKERKGQIKRNERRIEELTKKRGRETQSTKEIKKAKREKEGEKKTKIIEDNDREGKEKHN